jgi:transposase
MGGLELSAGERRRLRAELIRSRDARVYRRALAILEHDRGRPVVGISEALGVDRRSVYRWIETFRRSRSPKSLRGRRRPGRRRRWRSDCSDWLARLMTNRPTALGYPHANWTVPLIQEVIELVTGLRFSDDTIRRELKRLRFVWKRPRYVLAPDPEREKKTKHPA